MVFQFLLIWTKDDKGGARMAKYEYKVLHNRQYFLNFRPEELEQLINTYADDGWRVVTCSTDVKATSDTVKDCLVVMEREVVDLKP